MTKHLYHAVPDVDAEIAKIEAVEGELSPLLLEAATELKQMHAHYTTCEGGCPTLNIIERLTQTAEIAERANDRGAAKWEKLLRARLVEIRDHAMELQAALESSCRTDVTKHPVWLVAAETVERVEFILQNSQAELAIERIG